MDDELLQPRERKPLTAKFVERDPVIVLDGDLVGGLYRLNGMALTIDEAIELHAGLTEALRGENIERTEDDV